MSDSGDDDDKTPEIRGTLGIHFEQRVDPHRALYDADGGVHVLQDGDQLSVFSANSPDRLLWQGIVQLRLQHEPQSHTRHHLKLFQEGVSDARWNRWFDEACPASLVPATSRR